MQQYADNLAVKKYMKMEDNVLTPYLLVNGKHILKTFNRK